MSSYLKLIHEAVWSCCFGKHRKEVLLRYATFQLLIGYFCVMASVRLGKIAVKVYFWKVCPGALSFHSNFIAVI